MIQYLITDPKYYTSNPITFKKILTHNLSIPTQESENEFGNVDIACFRDKKSANFEELAKIFVEVCKEKNIQKILINSDLELAIKLKATGVHLTSTQFDKIQIAKQNKLFVIISCHTKDEIVQAKNKGADMVTYSPIFATPNKGKIKGCKDLANIIREINIPIIALGGIISQEQINQIKTTKANGFASIRYFIPK